jgi:glycosyltransferase involved in cell wall biosynthesis
LTVSVVIPVFNGEHYIRPALLSVIQQTYPAAEIIVVYQTSSDNSLEILDSFDQVGGLKVVHQPNPGLAAARNTGVEAASGDLVAFLDQDDVWFPDKLAAQVPLFEDMDVGVAGSFMTYLGPGNRPFGTRGEVVDGRGEDIAAARIMPFAASSMICRRSVLLEVGGFDTELIVPIDDFDCLSRMAASHRVDTVPRSLGYYRMRPDSLSFSRFYDLQRGILFLQDRIQHRRRGEEIAWTDWLAEHPTTIWEKWHERKQLLYRRAGLFWIGGRRGRGIAYMTIAALMGPRYVVQRAWQQFRTERHPPLAVLTE